MKKHVLFTLGLLLSSPLVLAQTDSGGTKGALPPVTPPTPAAPAPSDGSQPQLQAPTTDSQGNTTTGVKSKNGNLGASANPGKKSGSLTGDFAAMDANGDGSISRDEFGNSKGSMSFEQLDKNHDGKLSAAELKASNKGSAPDRQNPPTPTGAPQP